MGRPTIAAHASTTGAHRPDRRSQYQHTPNLVPRRTGVKCPSGQRPPRVGSSASSSGVWHSPCEGDLGANERVRNGDPD